MLGLLLALLLGVLWRWASSACLRCLFLPLPRCCSHALTCQPSYDFEPAVGEPTEFNRSPLEVPRAIQDKEDTMPFKSGTIGDTPLPLACAGCSGPETLLHAHVCVCRPFTIGRAWFPGLGQEGRVCGPRCTHG